MFLILSLPITLTSIVLYIFLTFLGSDWKVWSLSLAVSIFLLLFIFKDFKKNLNIRKYFSFKNILLLFLVLFFVFTKAFVLSPFVITTKTNFFEHIQVTDVGDYYKHSFVTTMLALDGLPPNHPYFPSEKLSYYLGYYLIPSSVSKLFNLYPNQVFYAFCLVTDILGLLIILRILNRVLNTYKGKLISLLLLISGVGINILPIIFQRFPLPGYKITPDAFWSEVGFQLINNYTSILFVPQHYFAACLTVGLVYYLIWERPKLLFSILTITFVLLSSLFVSWVLIIWLLLIFIFYPEKRLFLIFSTFFSLLILSPYLLLLKERENIFYLNRFKPYQFISSGDFSGNIVNITFTYLLQYGLILIILPIFLALKGLNFIKKNLILILGLLVPFVATWFIRSSNFNDFSMRGLMSVQLAIPILFIKVVENVTGKFLKKGLLLISLLTITIGFLALFLEYSNHWKSRLFLHPNVSKLLLEVRKIPPSVRLSAVDRDRWVEFIPSLAFKKVLSPYLFDSYVYFVGKKGGGHGEYERLALDLFIEPNIASDLKHLISDKNMHLSRLHEFFNKYSSDYLILNNQLWVKRDVNPWLMAFQVMGTELKPLTGNFTLVNYPSLLKKTQQFQIHIEENLGREILIKEKGLVLSTGFWYLSSCSEKEIILRLEFEDYYELFNQKLGGKERVCVGRIFYLQKDENVLLTHNSTVKNVYAYPIVIKSTNNF